ncbi:MAG TPA: hypothetical protein VFG13_04580, partial [Blastococcus sp.]|nr:hypothetical protein [Blastococcus sp.]
MHLWKIRRAIKDLHRASTEAASAAESAHAAAAAAAVSAGTAEESAEQARRSADSAERSVAEITSSQEATGTLPQRQRVKRILIISVSELILLVPFLLWLAVHAHWFIDQQTGEQDV